MRTVRADDLPAVAAMIEVGFAAFVADDFTDEGRAVFRDFATRASIAARLERGNKGFVALLGDRIAGYLEIEGNHIRLLFVERRALRRGVARALFRAATKDHAGRTITVNSSRYAIPAYERLGFRATTAIQREDGMTFLPMAQTLPDDSPK